MSHFHTRALLVTMLALPLGACNSFLGINLARHAPRAAPVAPAAPALAGGEASATVAGRALLAEGRTGLAIESFQRALASGEPIAPAVNGLGVAYARLGRFDLAQRYFRQAMASDPADPRYADNLARLMTSPTFVLRRDGDAVQATLRAAAVPQASAPMSANARAEPVMGRLQRVSRGEVRIATAPAQPAPIAVQRAAKVDDQFKPLVRFSIAEPSPQGSIRVVLPKAKPADVATAPNGEAGTATR